MHRSIVLSLLLLVACGNSSDPERAPHTPETAPLGPADRALLETLRKETVTFSFEAAPMAEALDFIRTLKNINLIIHDRIRTELEDSPVTLQVTDLEVDSALDLLLRLAGPEYAWVVRSGVVFVTDRESAQNDPVLRVHYLGDLTCSISRFVAPNLILEPAGTDVDETQPIFGEAEEEVKIVGGSARKLMELIIRNIAPGTWEGGETRISVSGEDRLVVVHTPKIQAEVARFIEDRR